MIRYATRFAPALFNDFATHALFRDVDSAPTERSWTPAADVWETKDAIEVTLDLPGFAPEQLDVKLEADTLTISATRTEAERKDGKALRQERRFGNFSRSFVLPDSVEGSDPQAKYAHGVLTVTLPKREEGKPKSVQVKVEG